MQTRRQREIGLFANSPDNVMPPYSKLKLSLSLSVQGRAVPFRAGGHGQLWTFLSGGVEAWVPPHSQFAKFQ